MIPTAKKQQMTNQYILVTKDCNSRNFISSYTLLGLSLPDSMSGAIIRSVSFSPLDARRDMILIGLDYLYRHFLYGNSGIFKYLDVSCSCTFIKNKGI